MTFKLAVSEKLRSADQKLIQLCWPVLERGTLKSTVAMQCGRLTTTIMQANLLWPVFWPSRLKQAVLK